MPATSQKQRAYLNARFGHAWVKKHHFDNKGKLPKRSKPPSKHGRAADRAKLLEAFKRRGGKRKRDAMIRQFQARHGGKSGHGV